MSHREGTGRESGGGWRGVGVGLFGSQRDGLTGERAEDRKGDRERRSDR